MDIQTSSLKNRDFKTETDWLNRISQQENPLREVYDLLIELSQQDKPLQTQTTDI